MKHILLISLVLTLSSTPILAKKGAGSYIQTKPAKVHAFALKALNNGKKYIAVKNSHLPLTFDVLVKARCGEKFHLSSAYYKVAGGSDGVAVNKKNRTYSKSLKPIKVKVPFAYPKNQPSPIKACNDALQQDALTKGKTKAQMLADGWYKLIYETYSYTGVFNLTCDEDRKGVFDEPRYYHASTKIGVAYECASWANANKPKPKPKAVPKRMKIPFAVKSASVKVLPSKYQGVCPAKINLKSAIQTNGKGIVKYRFLNSFGIKSPVKQVKFTGAMKKNLVNQIIIGLKSRPKKNQVPGMQIKAPDQKYFKGWIQLEVLSPKKLKSKKMPLEVRCKKLPQRVKTIS